MRYVGPSRGSMPLSTEPAVRVVVSFQKDGGATRIFFHMRHPNYRPVGEVDRWLRGNIVPHRVWSYVHWQWPDVLTTLSMPHADALHMVLIANFL